MLFRIFLISFLVVLSLSSGGTREVYAETLEQESEALWDIDASGKIEPLSDGILLLRYLFKLRGDDLIDRVVSSSATRKTATDIEKYLEDNLNRFDVDGNGKTEALNDGLLLMRYFFKFRGETLINGVVGSGATRTTAKDLEAYVDENSHPTTTGPDADKDGITDKNDNCPTIANKDQKDLDKDGLGDVCDDDRDGDGVKNKDDFFPDDPTSSSVPVVTISTPKTLTTVGASPIKVEGTINDAKAKIVINGIEIKHSGGKFTAQVALKEGSNAIIVRAIDKQNHEGTATVTISLDKTPPYVTIQSHKENAIVYTNKISIGGLVNDIVRGTVSAKDAIVKVNKINATVANRSFLAENVPLKEGKNTINVTASDAVGNVGAKSIVIEYKIQLDRKITLLSGQAQNGVILSDLAKPLKIKLTEKGKPVSGKIVTFRVVEGDGLLKPEEKLKRDLLRGQANQRLVGVVPLAAQINESQALVAITDKEGVAQINFGLGSRSGKGIHRVRAQAVGFEGEVAFYASATPKKGDKLGVIAGNNQRGSVRLPLPNPFVVAVTDLGSNLIEGAKIEFKVVQGSGKFKNNKQTQTVTTDKDGRASVHVILGAEEGLDAQRVTASLVGTTAIAGFTASAFLPGDPGKTGISGVVLDNQDNPLPKVTIRVEGTTRQAVSDKQGQFTITQVPVGAVHLIADGSTTSVAGEWPTLSYNLVTVPGVLNPLSSPIYLVQLDTEHAVYVGKEDQELTLPEMPGFKLKVKKGSVTFPDGKKEGFLSVTPVNANKIPMPPPNGMQPQFIVTIQPHGAKFDPPAELTLPNVDGHKVGAEVEMYSYDHDLEEFVTIGLGTVSKDGSVITSNNGIGVIKAGWHCGSQPGGSGCCEGGTGCGYCYDKEGKCPSKCKLIPERLAENQDKGNCQKELCGESQIDDSDKPESKCKLCDKGKVTNIPNDPQKKCGDGSEKQNCLICIDGNCRPPNCKITELDTTVSVKSDPAFTRFTSKIKTVVNKIPFITIETAELTISGSTTLGERCCKNCSDIGEKKGTYLGVAATGVLNVSAEAHIGPNFDKSINVVVKGYGISGRIKFKSGISLGLSISPQASLKGFYVDKCEEGCVSLVAGSDIFVTAKVTLLDAIAELDAVYKQKKKSIANIIIKAVGFAKVGTSNISMNLLSKGSACPENCTYSIGGGSLNGSVRAYIKIFGVPFFDLPEITLTQELWAPIKTGVCL